jgi:hypothetical protein
LKTDAISASGRTLASRGLVKPHKPGKHKKESETSQRPKKCRKLGAARAGGNRQQGGGLCMT